MNSKPKDVSTSVITTMKKSNALFCIVMSGCLAVTVGLQAQVAPTLGSPGGIDLNGGVDFTPSAQTGGASRFLWLPGKRALRVGYFPATGQWALTNSAIGSQSFALGDFAIASGSGSVAIGVSTAAGGATAAVIGNGGADGTSSFATAGGYAGGSYSVALGGAAGGAGSFAAGQVTDAEGFGSAVIGYNAQTFADYSTAIGTRNKGLRKDGSTPQPNTPNPGDPIFEVGNGTNPPTGGGIVSNALTVFRDGTVRLAKASGGISMGQFQ